MRVPFTIFFAILIDFLPPKPPNRGAKLELDLKKPDKYPLWLVRLGVLITKPFGVSLDLMDRKPWEALKRYFPSVSVQEVYGGFAYIAVGEKS